MGRRGRSGSSSPGRSMGGSPPSRSYSTTAGSPPRSVAAPRPAPPAPVKAPVTPATTTAQPSMGKQIAANAAATAGGVVAGHALMNAFSGSGRDDVRERERDGYASSGYGGQQGSGNDPCAAEFNNLMSCMDSSNDIGTCDAFNTLLKECRRSEDMKMKEDQRR